MIILIYDHLLLLHIITHKLLVQAKRYTDSFLKLLSSLIFIIYQTSRRIRVNWKIKQEFGFALHIFSGFLFWEAVWGNINSKHARGGCEGARFIIKVATKSNFWHCDLAWLWFHFKQLGMICSVLFSYYHHLGLVLLHTLFILSESRQR